MIQGVGLDAEKVIPYLKKEKLARVLIEQLTNEPNVAKKINQMIASGNFDELNVYDYLHGEPFDNIADLLTYCDNTDSITYGDDGEGGFYFYYPPSMPWEMRETEPKSVLEVHDRIIAAVQKVTDLDAETINQMIDDELNVVGFG